MSPRRAAAGSVLIDLPLDVQKSGLQVDFDPERGGPLHIAKPSRGRGRIWGVIETILEAERLILMPGGEYHRRRRRGAG